MNGIMGMREMRMGMIEIRGVRGECGKSGWQCGDLGVEMRGSG